eukprot:Colp12_sorted_trinity150504_noHs@12408
MIHYLSSVQLQGIGGHFFARLIGRHRARFLLRSCVCVFAAAGAWAGAAALPTRNTVAVRATTTATSTSSTPSAAAVTVLLVGPTRQRRGGGLRHDKQLFRLNM